MRQNHKVNYKIKGYDYGENLLDKKDAPVDLIFEIIKIIKADGGLEIEKDSIIMIDTFEVLLQKKRIQ